MGSVGIDFGEDEDSSGFEYHKLTDQQLKCKYTHIYLHMYDPLLVDIIFKHAFKFKQNFIGKAWNGKSEYKFS